MKRNYYKKRAVDFAQSIVAMLVALVAIILILSHLTDKVNYQWFVWIEKHMSGFVIVLGITYKIICYFGEYFISEDEVMEKLWDEYEQKRIELRR